MIIKDDTAKITTRERVLDEAKLLVTGKRQLDYGDPSESFKRIAGLWSAYTGTILTSLDVAMMMALLKISRAKNSPGHMDSYSDLAGYAAIAAELSEVLGDGNI